MKVSRYLLNMFNDSRINDMIDECMLSFNDSGQSFADKLLYCSAAAIACIIFYALYLLINNAKKYLEGLVQQRTVHRRNRRNIIKQPNNRQILHGMLPVEQIA